MSNAQSGRWWSNAQALRRMIPLVGVLLASMALLGVGASTAAAEPVGFFIAGEKSEEVAKQPKFEAEKYTSNVTGKNNEAFTLAVQAGQYKCGSVSFSSTIAAATNKLRLQSIFLTCSFSGLAPSLLMNGCEWEMHVSNAGPPYVGTYDLVCPNGKAMEIQVFSGGTKVCTVTIPPQTGIQGLTFQNTGAGSGRAVVANYNLTGIKYSQASSSPFFCVTGEYTNGTYTGSETFTAAK